MLKPPAKFCNQSITLRTKTAEDELYPDETTWVDQEIDNCVVHLRTVYSGSNNDRQITANGTIMIYAGISTPFPDLVVKDVDNYHVIYEGVEYTVTNINEDRNPLSNEMYQYKLQIL